MLIYAAYLLIWALTVSPISTVLIYHFHMNCRQYGAMMHQKEQNKQHPIYRLFSTRTNTIRKHRQRGKISDDLRREAIRLAESYRDKALLDNDYAEHGYALDMEQEHLYGEARKHMREKEGG